jgi:hypothetical protein
MENYFNWINNKYPTPEKARKQCLEATLDMVYDFPELRRLRGHILVEEPFDLPPTKTTHWWCVDPDGNIVDPTAHQYPTRIIDYLPLDESKGEPTGKCPNCGDLCYEEQYLCTSKCEKEYMIYLMG